jgi:hypothetical protein
MMRATAHTVAENPGPPSRGLGANRILCNVALTEFIGLAQA